jgi:hypothetical protein
MFVTFCPDNTASYKSLNEWPEEGRFGVFVNVASEDVGNYFWIRWNELNGLDKEPCQNSKSEVQGPRHEGSGCVEDLRYCHTVISMMPDKRRAFTQQNIGQSNQFSQTQQSRYLACHAWQITTHQERGREEQRKLKLTQSAPSIR